MKINTNSLVSITEANQNFSKVARLVDEKGSAIILKNNNPKYIILDYNQFDSLKLADDEDISIISKRLIEKNKKAYEELAK
ncbi:type II toxin-antitoxin system Phd/YefM family antitoxin [Peptoniphilus sp. SGI.035]|uniref:type II toxin-antitoxin system Phd/YefM family antitoxin n=1 Tax=Peptoniphilus sp. SGI.035 TaxID=3420564 RepID=UPI003CFF2294